MEMHNDEMGMDKKMMRCEWHSGMGVRMLTMVIVIIFFFWCGFELGEIRASVGLDRSYGMMQGGWGGGVIEYGMRPTTLSTQAVPQAGTTGVPMMQTGTAGK